MRFAGMAAAMLCAGPGAGAAPPVTITVGLAIHAETSVQSRTYRLADPGAGIVEVTGSGYTIDFHGATIIGTGGNRGVGIAIRDARNVTIRHASVHGCLWGVQIERSVGVRLVDCDFSANANLPPGTVIDESGREAEDNHGGGIVIRDSRDCLVKRCASAHQWDGIDIVRSEGCRVEDGDFSYNGNWGVHLWDSSRCTFRRNRAVWCTTGGGMLYQALTGWQTYDAQAVGIDHNSCENLIEENDLRFGGDAIFIRANEGPITPGTVVPPRNGSHRNVLRNNDCSFSPNNAIEVDLVDDTVIEGNNCSWSHYGMWLGYSRRCIVRHNTCVNDTEHAVEIENGQGDLFEANVFGADNGAADNALVYLRQNGREATPSRGYVFRDNLFYGSQRGVLLHNTEATIVGNTLHCGSPGSARIVVGDAGSHITESGNRSGAGPAASVLKSPDTVVLHPGTVTTLRATGRLGPAPPVVEVDGIPMWVRRWSEMAITVWMPDDMWDRPARDAVNIHVVAQDIDSGLPARIAWPPGHPRINSVSPNPAKIGDEIAISGAALAGGKLLLNGVATPVRLASPARITFSVPPGILVPTRYNIVWEPGKDAGPGVWPITFAVDVRPEKMPHLISAVFTPTHLRVGERLMVTMKVRNNLPTPAPATTQPAPWFTYDEKQAAAEMGLGETAGRLDLRVSTDFTVGGHDPGSWPWLFGFPEPALAPGETVTVTGYIKVETPGVHEFRVGLVAGGFRFIDDNAFRTRVTVDP